MDAAAPLQKSFTIVILVLFIELCLVVDSFNKYREHRKHSTLHGNTNNNNNNAYDGDYGDDDDEFALHNECYYRYVETDHHYAFLHCVAQNSARRHKGRTADNHRDTPAGCDRRRRMKQPIHANMPIIDRALCPYEYTLNYKPNRIPATLSEVKCTCTRPFITIGRAGAQLECEPLYYHVRVLLFESDCLSFVEHTEKIAFACVPVFKATIEKDDLLIDVPAEEPPV
uniref:Prothoracicotropic hormone n=1 Tax=Globodera rostochiensis TaxID=31243 RepID=A0A914IEK2_GLORO